MSRRGRIAATEALKVPPRRPSFQHVQLLDCFRLNGRGADAGSEETDALFDHLVGAAEQHWGHLDATHRFRAGRLACVSTTIKRSS
jgi:hypothetical protein